MYTPHGKVWLGTHASPLCLGPRCLCQIGHTTAVSPEDCSGSLQHTNAKHACLYHHPGSDLQFPVLLQKAHVLHIHFGSQLTFVGEVDLISHSWSIPDLLISNCCSSPRTGKLACIGCCMQGLEHQLEV